MTDKAELSDEAIRALLEKRAGRPDVAGRLATARSAAAATPQHRVGRFLWGSDRRPTLVGATGLAALMLVLVVVGLASIRPGSGSPTGSPLVGSSSPGPNLSPLPSSASGPIVLTVDELNGLIAADPNAVLHRELVIDGQIASANVRCAPRLGGTLRPCSPPPRGFEPRFDDRAHPGTHLWSPESRSACALLGNIRRCSPGERHARLPRPCFNKRAGQRVSAQQVAGSIIGCRFQPRRSGLARPRLDHQPSCRAIVPFNAGSGLHCPAAVHVWRAGRTPER